VLPVIGFLSGSSADQDAGRLRGFRQGLSEMGYVEGRNVAIEYRWAEERMNRLRALAADLVGRKVAVIVSAACARSHRGKEGDFDHSDPLRIRQRPGRPRFGRKPKSPLAAISPA